MSCPRIVANLTATRVPRHAPGPVSLSADRRRVSAPVAR
jgi:hypothetical protein